MTTTLYDSQRHSSIHIFPLLVLWARGCAGRAKVVKEVLVALPTVISSICLLFTFLIFTYEEGLLHWWGSDLPATGLGQQDKPVNTGEGGASMLDHSQVGPMLTVPGMPAATRGA